jgi:hypothetical protein
VPHDPDLFRPVLLHVASGYVLRLVRAVVGPSMFTIARVAACGEPEWLQIVPRQDKRAAIGWAITPRLVIWWIALFSTESLRN